MKNILLELLIVFVIILLCVGCDTESSSSLPKDPSQMTNKQYQQYMEWNAKQDQQEWENQKAFK